MKRLQLSLQGQKSLVADLTTMRVPPQPTANPVINSLQLYPLSLSFAMQATPSTKGVACATICCCCQQDSDVYSIVY